MEGRERGFGDLVGACVGDGSCIGAAHGSNLNLFSTQSGRITDAVHHSTEAYTSKHRIRGTPGATALQSLCGAARLTPDYCLA